MPTVRVDRCNLYQALANIVRLDNMLVTGCVIFSIAIFGWRGSQGAAVRIVSTQGLDGFQPFLLELQLGHLLLLQ